MLQSFYMLQNTKRMSLVPVAVNLARLIVCPGVCLPPLLITINSVLARGKT